MNNEWNRLQSFKGFPEYFPVSPIRLAGEGFYYTGTGRKAVCFCCGLEIDSLNDDETVFQIHRRLSPDCRFVTGKDSTNEPIHSETSVHQSAEVEQMAYKQPDYHSKTSMEDERIPGGSPYPPGGAVGSVWDENKSLLCISGTRADSKIQITRSQTSLQGNGQIELYPGITSEKPKHPDYAVKSVRLSSFTNWCHGVMDPDQMAEAGFYYIGVHDCVKCFFCGGGMKDWQAGDNAWIEHARWFPNCAYVKQYKGEDFINMCRMANIEYLTNEGDAQVPECWNIERHGERVAEQLIEDLNCAEAKLVFGMGYGQGDVENAIKLVRQKYGNAELRAQYILECLLDNAHDVKEEISSRNKHPGTSTDNSDHKLSSASACASLQKAEKHVEISKEQQILLEENRQLKESMACKICMDKDACIVFLPCGHMVSCMECAPALRKCAVCRTIIQGTVRAYPG